MLENKEIELNALRSSLAPEKERPSYHKLGIDVNFMGSEFNEDEAQKTNTVYMGGLSFAYAYHSNIFFNPTLKFSIFGSGKTESDTRKDIPRTKFYEQHLKKSYGHFGYEVSIGNIFKISYIYLIPSFGVYSVSYDTITAEYGSNGTKTKDEITKHKKQETFLELGIRYQSQSFLFGEITPRYLFSEKKVVSKVSFGITLPLDNLEK